MYMYAELTWQRTEIAVWLVVGMTNRYMLK